jgi:hypothetical protein
MKNLKVGNLIRFTNKQKIYEVMYIDENVILLKNDSNTYDKIYLDDSECIWNYELVKFKNPLYNYLDSKLNEYIKIAASIDFEISHIEFQFDSFDIYSNICLVIFYNKIKYNMEYNNFSLSNFDFDELNFLSRLKELLIVNNIKIENEHTDCK